MERVTSTRGRHRHRQICISSQNSLSSPFLTLRMQFLIFGLWGKFGSFGFALHSTQLLQMSGT